jgi:hypothetical protein
MRRRLTSKSRLLSRTARQLTDPYLCPPPTTWRESKEKKGRRQVQTTASHAAQGHRSHSQSAACHTSAVTRSLPSVTISKKRGSHFFRIQLNLDKVSATSSRASGDAVGALESSSLAALVASGASASGALTSGGGFKNLWII